MSTDTLATKLLQSYKQAFIYMLATFVNVIIGVIIAVIGFFQAFTAFDQTTFQFNSVQFTIGVIIAVIGYFIIIIGIYAALIYTATKGGKSPLGFIESWKETIKLILELAVAVIFGILLVIIGGYLGQIGGLFIFVGMILLMLFPMAALFYVLNYLQNR